MILLAILAGILATLTIRRTTDASRLHATIRKIQADLLEFRLYFDEPRLIWQAQVSLVRDNLRLMLLFLPATLILALPMGWLILQLDVVYGLRPLHPGEAAVFTAQLNRPLNPADEFVLHGTPGVKVEMPAVRVLRDNQIAWRIRPSSDGRAELELLVNGRTVRKSILSGESPMILSPRRSSSLADFVMHPAEPRLPEGDVAWLAVDYPRTDAAVPWLAWFLIISTVAAWVTARYTRVLN